MTQLLNVLSLGPAKILSGNVASGLNDVNELTSAFARSQAVAHRAGINREIGDHTYERVHAAPETVWNHVVSFSQLAPPTERMFKTGIAAAFSLLSTFATYVPFCGKCFLCFFVALSREWSR